jgi:hypothetical protein
MTRILKITEKPHQLKNVKLMSIIFTTISVLIFILFIYNNLRIGMFIVCIICTVLENNFLYI